MLSALCSLLLLALCTAQQEGDVRLVGPTDYQGTVAVYHNGKWGTICDDSWNYRDADVVCKQLGYERAFRIYYRAYYGQGPGTKDEIWIDQIRCPSGAKHILDCDPPVSQWGVHDCKKSEDAGVDCLRKIPRKPDSLPIRLECPECTQWGSCKSCSDKTHPSESDCSPKSVVEGIVFAQYENEWYPVAGEGWDEKDAEVACGELGYPVSFGIPSLEDLWTNYDGSYLDSCTAGNSGLFNGPNYPKCSYVGEEEGSGTLLGTCTNEEIYENDDFRDLLQQSILKKVQCSGKESRLLDCYFPDFGPHSNPSLSVATVRCGFKPHSSCSSQDNGGEIYRLRGGPVPWQGRVEARVNDEWGTIGDQEWELNEGTIVCKALGFGSARRTHFRAYYGRGVGTIHYTNLKCTGSEATLGDCPKRTGSVAQSFGHKRDAGLECNVPTPCPDPDGRLSRLYDTPQPLYPQQNDSYAEVNGPQGWGFVCRNSLTPQAANVICREDRELFAFQIRKGLQGHSGPSYRVTIDCEGDETSLEDCDHVSFSYVSSCPSSEGYAVLDCTAGLPDLVPDVKTLANSLKNYPYIDRTPLYYLECAAEENCLSSSAEGKGPNNLRSLLRFDSLTMNWGRNDFLPDQNRDQWQFHTCHNHYHSFEAFIHYDLLNATTGHKEAEGHKASFCLEDSRCEDATRRYGCSSGQQGISTNCGDLYGRYLDCQWIDVTDVPAGRYLLRLIVNPDYLVAESDHNNNQVECGITITSSYGINFHSCALSDH